MTRAILFDFNGVLVNDEPQHCEALITTLDEYGYALDRERYYAEYLGFDDRECFRFTFERLGRPTDPASLSQAIERKASHYERAIRTSMQLVPGAHAFVHAAVDDGLALAVVSGALRREIDLVLGEAGLLQHFPVIVAAEDVAACKPDPEGYRRAQRLLGVAPAACMVIEDSLPGLAAARGAGARCVMIATSHGREMLAGADAVWDDLDGRHPAELPWLTP